MSIESDMHLRFEVPGKLDVWVTEGKYICVQVFDTDDEAFTDCYFEPSELRPLARMLNKMIKRIEAQNDQSS
jgi:hypothetical protein